MTQRTPVTVFVAKTSTSTTLPYATDYRFEDNPNRVVAGTLTAGDTLSILVSPNPVSVATEVWVTVGAITATPFTTVIPGPWPRFKFQKSGTTGVMTVYAVL